MSAGGRQDEPAGLGKCEQHPRAVAAAVPELGQCAGRRQRGRRQRHAGPEPGRAAADERGQQWLAAVGTSFSNTAASGTLTVNGALDLSGIGGGGLLLQSQAGDLSINSGATLTVPGVISLQTLATGNHRVTNAGTILIVRHQYLCRQDDAGGRRAERCAVGLESGNNIDLGASSGGSGTLTLSNGDLNSVDATQLTVSVNSSHGGTAISSSARRCRSRPAWR
jgi:hypothetical protein